MHLKTKKISSDYLKLDFSALEEMDKTLIEKAEKQAKKAYAPYSNFYVGAAVLLANGKIISGSNQENASYPLCLCAERVALFAAHSRYPNVPIKKIAIVAINPNNPVKNPISPCGACRQVIRESEIRSKGDIQILLKGETTKTILLDTVKILLPMSFDGSAL